MNLVSLPITAIYAALCGFLVIALAANVVRFRLGKKVSLGDGGHKDVNRAIRAHGNTMEYVPLALLLMALLEINGGGDTALHIYGAVTWWPPAVCLRHAGTQKQCQPPSPTRHCDQLDCHYRHRNSIAGDLVARSRG